MNEVLVLAISVGAIWLALLLLRMPVVPVIFGILIGHLLANEASSDAYDFIGSLLQIPEYYYVQVALFILPLLLILLFMKGRLAKSKVVLEAVPLLFSALLLITLLYPLVPELKSVVNEATQGKADNYKTLIIAGSSISALISLLITHPRNGHKKHGKHH
jgi:hypothetical protein